MQYQLAIIVPCYNEANSISIIVDEFSSIVQQHPFVQVILVNNGSTDDTAVMLQSIVLHKNISCVHVPTNQGYGYGIMQGIQQATAPVLSFTHADLQTNPADVIRAFTLYQQHNNEMLIIKGKRMNRNKLDAFFTWGMELYTNFKLKTTLHDINAQPKLFSQQFYHKLMQQAPSDFSFDLFLLYNAQKLGQIKTIDVSFFERKFGEAKGGGTLKGKWKLIKRTIHYINALAKKYA